jgi:hypothetical protein
MLAHDLCGTYDGDRVLELIDPTGSTMGDESAYENAVTRGLRPTSSFERTRRAGGCPGSFAVNRIVGRSPDGEARFDNT